MVRNFIGGMYNYANIIIVICGSRYKSGAVGIEGSKNKEGNEKATKGIAVYYAQQAIEKMVKSEIYRVSPNINPRQMYTDWEAAGRYDLHFSVRIDSIEKAIRLAQSWMKELKTT